MNEPTDPTHATSAELKRRVFVGLSAGTVVLGKTVAAAFAAGEEFGRPHPPIVGEDDPTIATGRPTITYEGRSLEAYYASPRNAGPATPGIVVVQAIWGVDAQLRDVVRRLAKEGYIAIAPGLYSGLGAPSGDGVSDFATFRDAAAKLADETVDRDLAAAANFLRSGAAGHRMKVGVTGFCMGGASTLRQAVDNAAAFQAVAVWYGKVRYGTTGNEGPITPIALAYADEIALPLLGSYGGRDTSILAEDVRALDQRLAERKKPHDIKVYDEAGHAFFDDTRDSYVSSAASDAWTRTLAWFSRYLK